MSLDSFEALALGNTGHSTSLEESIDLDTTEDESNITVVANPKATRVRLCGAARKRFKYLVGKGHEPEEARLLALKPIDREAEGTPQSTKKSGKRQRSEDTPEKGTSTKRSKPAEPAPEGMAHRSRPPLPEGSVRIGVTSAKFPEEQLDLGQMKAIQEAVLDKILEQKGGDIKPKFLGSSFKPGWLAFICANATTANWLCNIVGAIKPWKDASLKTLKGDELPKAQIIYASFLNSSGTSNQRLLDLIEEGN